MNSSLLSLSISKVSELLRNKSLNASDLCKLCLNRINKTKNLNAYISVTENLAEEQAEAAEKRILNGNSKGVLDGIPIAFKDNWNVKNTRTTCASKMLYNYVSPYNATVAQRLINSGAVITGKTNLDEFAMGSATVDSYFGPSKNPWRSGVSYKLKKLSKKSDSLGEHENASNSLEVNDDPLENEDFFVSGGSSGGGAVAVATGCCFGAIGSDTGGSTRNPAAFCGLIGLKPTYGLVSRHGLIPLCNSLDVPGILTRSIDDAVLLLNSIGGHDCNDSTTVKENFLPIVIPDDISIKDMHFGLPKEYECQGMTPEIIETWRKVADILDNAGAKVSEVSLPHTKYSIMCYSVLCCCDVASNFARYDGIRYGHRAKEEESSEHHYAVTRREGFGDVVRERILAGNYFLLRNNYPKYFLKAAKVRRLICNDFKSVYESGIDLLLTPVTLTEPVPYSKWILMDNREHNAVDDFCTQPVNMAGLPAVSIPCRLSSNGLPLSLQLVGQPFKEKEMLTSAKWIEQHVQFPIFDIVDDLETKTSYCYN